MAGNSYASGDKAHGCRMIVHHLSTTSHIINQANTNRNPFNMKYSTLLTSLSASLAAADFHIFWTREQVDGLEGASFFNSAPSCDDAGNSVTVVNLGGRNDASLGGVSLTTVLYAGSSKLTVPLVDCM
jgi:hypothetical protein